MKRLLLLGMMLALLLPGAAMATERGLLRGAEAEATARPLEVDEGLEMPGETEAGPTAAPSETGGSRGLLRGVEAEATARPLEGDGGRGLLRGTGALPAGAQHLLWDIPFGTPAWEVEALVQEKTGLTLEPGWDNWGGAALATTASPPVEMLGRLVRIDFSLDEEDRLSHITVSFQPESAPMKSDTFPQADAEAGILNLLQTEYAGMHDAVALRYGPPEGGVLVAASSDGEVFDYPGGAEGLDLPRIAQAAAETELACVISRYGNVYEIAMVTTGEADAEDPESMERANLYVMLLLLEDGTAFGKWMPEVPEITGFETENGPYIRKPVHVEL